MADYKATAAQLASIANAIRLKGGTSAALEYPDDWIDAIENLTPSSGGSEITPTDPTVEYKVTDTDLEAIADAIRERGETSDSLIFPTGFVSAIEDISGGGGVEIVPWSSGTDEQIVAMLQAAHNGDIDLQTDGGWSVGDVRSVTVGAFTAGGNVSVPQQDIDIVISSFAEYASCGNVMQFDFKKTLSESIRMNATNTNLGGWAQTEMKTVTMPALVNALPTWLKDSLIEFTTVGDSTTGNKLALRSGDEVWNAPISYYTNSEHRKKENAWWLRDRYTGNNNWFWKVNWSGGSDKVNPTYVNGVSPFGCL